MPDTPKKIALLCLIMILGQMYSLAQFPLYVFPTGVSGDPYGDGLLNTPAILKKAGVRKIEAYQTLSTVTKTFKTKVAHLNTNGYINKLTICFDKNDSSGFKLCVDDTLTYDNLSRLVDIKTTDNKGNKYPELSIKYVDVNASNYSMISRYIEDSLTSYKSYHNGQLVNAE